MPRMDRPSANLQLIKLLLIGDGKCGKTDFAGMAADAGFNVLYLDGDVGAQTIMGLPIRARERIYLLNTSDRFTDMGGIDTHFAHFFKDWTAKPTIIWNDSQQRQYSTLKDKPETVADDEFWLIKPARMDHTCVLVLDSWSSLSQSAMQWAANEYQVDLGEVGDDRKDMRKVYQAAGEKLTQYLLAIQNAPCHVICLSHPSEFIKTKKPDGKTIGSTTEKDLKVLWTKLVPKSSSNNHALSMAKYFTDVAWMEAKLMGKRVIDFRVDNEKISGGHFNEMFDIQNRDKGDKDGFTFAKLVEKVGGTIPNGASTDHWLTIQTGYEGSAPKKAAALIVPKAATPAVNANPSDPSPQPVSQVKGLASLAGLKQRGPAKA